jgi:hypothetical protein
VDNDFERSLRDTLRAVISESASDRIGKELDDLGWSELVSETPLAFSLLYDELGRAARSTALIDQLVLSELGSPLAGCCDAVVYQAPAQDLRPPAQCNVDGIIVDGWAMNPPDMDERLLIWSAKHSEQSPAAIAITTLRSAPGLDIRPANTLDSEGSWVRITGRVLHSEAETITDFHGQLRDGVRTSARRAAAAEMAGLAHGILGLAIEHVATRTQFGRPIGSFQAVRHRLADARTLAAGTDALLEDAWDTGSAESADLALAYAGHAHRLIGSHCLQVCGAMGLTWEHDLHRYLRRGYTLDAAFGPAARITEYFGAQLIARTANSESRHSAEARST